MKNLQKLQRDGLLKSKSYGLGKEMLWQIYPSRTATSPKRIQTQIIEDYDCETTSWEVHSQKYEHEKACADVFVSLALSDTLLEWEGEGDQKSGFRADRKFRIDERVFYLEVERGSQGPDKLRKKLARYIEHYRKTREPFHVLFTVTDEKAAEEMIYLFDEFKLGSQYAVVVHGEFATDVLTASISTRFETFNFSNQLSNHAPSD